MKDLLEQLEGELSSLMFRWSPTNGASDYECVFCYRRAKMNGELEIHHSKDCLGVKLQQMFNECTIEVQEEDE
jgi:hypothetical protein